MIKIIPYRNIWLSISGLLVIASVAAILFWGLKFGIDFTGGSLMELRFNQERPSNAQIEEALAPLDLGQITIQPVEDKEVLLRFKNVDDDTHQKILQALNEKFGAPEEPKTSEPTVVNAPGGANQPQVLVVGEEKPEAVTELRFESVGPVVGQELARKAVYAMIFVWVVIILYVAWAFRQVSFPVQSWKYGVLAVVSMFHNVIGVVGLFAVLGKFYDVQIDATFIAALLTVLGYSVNDNIVIFDRIRENLQKRDDLSFADVVNVSLNETLSRSLITGVSTMLSLIAVYFFGGDSIKSFALALFWGIFLGTYASIFLASPLLVVWYNWDRARRSK